MSGETCFRKNTVRPAFVDAGRTVFQNMACFLRFSSASGRFDRIAPTVGQVSSSGQLPQVAAPRFKAHWRMPQRWSQNTVLTPSVRQPWQLICSGRMGALFNSAHSFAVLSRRACYGALQGMRRMRHSSARSKRSDHPWLYPPELFGDSVRLPFGAYETVGLSRPDAGRPDWRGRPWPASAPAPPRRW